MIYEIVSNNEIIGTTEFEGGDPPMGFVTGSVTPTTAYTNNELNADLSVFIRDTKEQIKCTSVTIEDLSEEFGEQVIEVTALVESAEEYDKYFMHHSEAYEKQFS